MKQAKSLSYNVKDRRLEEDDDLNYVAPSNIEYLIPQNEGEEKVKKNMRDHIEQSILAELKKETANKAVLLSDSPLLMKAQTPKPQIGSR